VTAFRELTTCRESSHVVGIIAVSTAVDAACDSVYRPGLSHLPTALTTTIKAAITDYADRCISLLWTTVDNVAALSAT